MRKKIIYQLAILHCILLMLPGLAFAADNPQESTDTNLDEVVVTAIPLEKYLLTTSVITAKDIEAKGARNLAEALKDVPGLNLHRNMKNNTSLDIRGVTTTDVKIFIDGVLVDPLARTTNSSAVDVTMIPVDNIAKIEVIKGPAPVIYGTDAKGGVILITTKSGKDSNGGKVSLSGGTQGTLNGSVSVGGGNDKFSYYINGGSEHTDGFTTDSRETKYINTKLFWRLQDDASLTFTGGYSTTNKGCLNETDPIDGHIISSKQLFWPGLQNWEFKDWERSNLLLSYAKKASDKLDYTVKIYRYTEKQGIWAYGPTGYSGLYGNITVKSGSTGYSTQRWNYSPWDSALKGMEIQSNFKLNSLHTLTYGVLYNDIDWKKAASVDPVNDPNDPNNYYWLHYKNKRYGYYLQDNFVPNEKTTITFGVRHDKNEISTDTNYPTIEGSTTDPTVNILYQVDKRNTLRGSYGETYGFPSAEQLYSAMGPNPGLKPEKSKNYEIGFKHQFDQTATGDLAIFENDITDKIDKNPNYHSTSDPVYINFTTAKIKGLELELNKKFSSRWDGFFNYTRLNTAAVNADGSITDFTYTPRNHINYGVSYQADKGYKFSLTGHWVTERYTIDNAASAANDTRTTVNGQKPVYSHLGGYHTIDLEIKRQINDRQDWYITVNNIFDKQYYDELFILATGRSVLVGTDIKF